MRLGVLLVLSFCLSEVHHHLWTLGGGFCSCVCVLAILPSDKFTCPSSPWSSWGALASSFYTLQLSLLPLSAMLTLGCWRTTLNMNSHSALCCTSLHLFYLVLLSTRTAPLVADYSLLILAQKHLQRWGHCLHAVLWLLGLPEHWPPLCWCHSYV